MNNRKKEEKKNRNKNIPEIGKRKDVHLESK
jgi:hypothetical protein